MDRVVHLLEERTSWFVSCCTRVDRGREVFLTEAGVLHAHSTLLEVRLTADWVKGAKRE